MKKVIKKARKVVVKKSDRETIVSLILDESGSMASCCDNTIKGFNEYIQGLKVNTPKTTFTLTKFDSSKIEVVHAGVPVKHVPELNHETYAPGALTPLYDAIGKTFSRLEAELKSRKDKPAVLVVIMTDGLENASTEYTAASIKELISKKEKEGWAITYLGANQDSWAVGQTLGISRGNTMNYGTGDIHNVIGKGLLRSTIMYSSCVEKGTENSSAFFAKWDTTGETDDNSTSLKGKASTSGSSSSK